MKSRSKIIAATALLCALVAVATVVSPTVLVNGAQLGAPGKTAGDDWMKALDGAKLISQFSIPGTHDSGALFEPIRGTAKCQNLTIPAQLGAGVRFLDIRCRHQNDAFEIYHGPIYQKDNFENVVGYCLDFLRAHPSETIIMSVKEEYGATGNTRSFESTFDDYVARNPSAWLLNSTISTLNQARGKIVLLRRFHAATPMGIDASNWPDNQTFENEDLRVQDIYKVSDTDDKWNSIESLLTQTRDDAATPLALNFCSGFKALMFGIPNVPAVANEINPRLSQFFAANSRGHFGYVIMDFADEKLCAAIYGTNDNSAARLSSEPDLPGASKVRGGAS